MGECNSIIRHNPEILHEFKCATMKWTVRLLCFVMIGIASCGQKVKDKGVKLMIGSAARQEVAFAGVNYRVANGVVTLSG